jgi:hypothetical protein
MLSASGTRTNALSTHFSYSWFPMWKDALFLNREIRTKEANKTLTLTAILKGLKTEARNRVLLNR